MLGLGLLRMLCLVATCRLPRVLATDNHAEHWDHALLLAHQFEDTQQADESLENSTPDGKQKALIYSVFQGSAKMVKWSLQNGADATLEYEDAGTPMMVAAHEGHLDILALLKEHGVEPQAVDTMQACRGAEEKHTRAVEWCFKNGVSMAESAIYGACVTVTENEGTKEFLENLKIEEEVYGRYLGVQELKDLAEDLNIDINEDVHEEL